MIDRSSQRWLLSSHFWNEKLTSLFGYCFPWMLTFKESPPMTVAARYDDYPQLHFTIATPHEALVSEAAEFLIQHFFVREPMGTALQVDAEREIRPWICTLLHYQFKEGMTIMIREVDEDGDIVALCLNDVERKQVANRVTIMDSVRREHHPNMWKITRLLQVLTESVDLFERYQVDSLVMLQMLCVRDSYSRRGLGQQMIRLTEGLSRQRGHRLLVSEATSAFSTRAFHNAAFQCDAVIEYQDFDIDGEKPFVEIAPVHRGASLMVKLLN